MPSAAKKRKIAKKKKKKQANNNNDYSVIHSHGTIFFRHIFTPLTISSLIVDLFQFLGSKLMSINWIDVLSASNALCIYNCWYVYIIYASDSLLGQYTLFFLQS